jgi:hypothetical protein
MLRASEFKEYLEQQFPGVTFYNGTIDKTNPQCIGIYNKGTNSLHTALGGINNISYSTLSVSILVHWTENTDTCEVQADRLYECLQRAENFKINNKRIVCVELHDPHPIDVSRDENNIAEMVIRATIYYEREVI